MNTLQIALFIFAALCGIGSAVMLVVHLSQKTYAAKREVELTTPPPTPPAGWVAPTATEVDELKAKAKGSFMVVVVLGLLTVALVAAGFLIPALANMPGQSQTATSAVGNAPVSQGPGATIGCPTPKPADANGFTAVCLAGANDWTWEPLNGIANTPVCDGTQNDAASKGLTFTDCQYFDTADSTWKLLSAFYGAPVSSGPQSPTNTTCTQGVMPVENGFSFTWDAVSCAWLKTAVVSGGPTNTTCTQGVMPVENGFSFTWDAVSCAWLKTAVVSGGPTNINNPTNPVAVDAPANSLKYDMEGCDPNDYQACVPSMQWDWYQKDPATRLLFPALYLQRVQAGEMTPAEAIAQIQSMAAGWAITSDNWTSYDVDPVWPTLIWNAQRNTCDFVPDTAFPLLQATGVPQEWYFSIAVVQPHLPANPAAGQIKVTCTTSDNWAVLVH